MMMNGWVDVEIQARNLAVVREHFSDTNLANVNNVLNGSAASLSTANRTSLIHIYYTALCLLTLTARTR